MSVFFLSKSNWKALLPVTTYSYQSGLLAGKFQVVFHQQEKLVALGSFLITQTKLLRDFH